MQQHTKDHPSFIPVAKEISVQRQIESQTEWNRYLPAFKGYLRAMLFAKEVPAAEALFEEASRAILTGSTPIEEVGGRGWDVVYEIAATIESQRSKEDGN